MIVRRPRRLQGFHYAGRRGYALTLCTALRTPVFTTDTTVSTVLTLLRHVAAELGFAVTAYCFMPDHVHLLVAGTDPQADLPAFVARFKQASGYWYRQQTGRRLWQPGYHDRILREQDDLDEHVRYIVANPVRAGFARAVGDYPFAGLEGGPASHVVWDERQG